MVDWSKLETVKTDADNEQEAKRIAALAYLKSTDWYVIRLVETGDAIPVDIQQARAAARSVLTQPPAT